MAHNVDSQCILVHTRHTVLRSNPRDRYSHLHSVVHNKRTSAHTTSAISEADFSPNEYDRMATCGFTMEKEFSEVFGVEPVSLVIKEQTRIVWMCCI